MKGTPMETISALLLIGAAVVLCVILFKILSGPMRLITKLLINTAIGYVILFIFAFFAEFFEVSIELSLLNAVIVGVLGIPGILLLVLLAIF